MTSNTAQIITNLLVGLIGFLWLIKIGFHFSYVKAVDNKLKERNFISFFINPDNFLKSIFIVAPFTFPTKVNGEIQGKRTRVVTYLLWATFAVTFFFLINYPPTKEPRQVIYDFTK